MTRSVGSRVSIIVGAVLGVVSLVAVGFGIAGLVTSHSHYVTVGNSKYSTKSYVVISQPYDWSGGRQMFAKYGDVEVTVTPAPGSKAVFVGLAPDRSVKPYLSGAGHVTALTGTGDKATAKTVDGSAPSDTSFVPWTAKAAGNGTVTFRVPADRQAGPQDLVVLNDDLSPVVAGQIQTSVTTPDLALIATIELVAGLIVLMISIGLVSTPIRRSRRATRRDADASVQSAERAATRV